ncbi:MAG: hypothetical protein EAS48_07645 [Chryseobacterium sp.]|nr:MAG: hypothetical protein EAS48_07645 [Chryseobacterium sp.]
MQLEKIISISGKPGLFRLISQLRTGFIVEDIATGRRTNINNSSQVSLLDNIAIFTVDGEAPLFDVLESIAKKFDYKHAISHKSASQELRSLMDEVLPEYDAGRVYESDIKKMLQWYNLLQKAGFITPESFVKPETSEETSDKESVEDTAETK